MTAYEGMPGGPGGPLQRLLPWLAVCTVMLSRITNSKHLKIAFRLGSTTGTKSNRREAGHDHEVLALGGAAEHHMQQAEVKGATNMTAESVFRVRV